jgi:hypothetical protein
VHLQTLLSRLEGAWAVFFELVRMRGVQMVALAT